MIVLLIFAAFILSAAVGLLYLYTRFRRFLTAYRWKEFWLENKKNRKWMACVFSMLPVLCLILYCILDPINGVVVTVNLLAIWLIADLSGWIVKKITKKTPDFYLAGVCAILFSILYLGSGWYFAHHVFETDYQLTTKKDLGTDQKAIRIVQISDSHVGATFDGDGFAKHMETIQQTHPDLLVITGDFVDDDTTRKDMQKCCEALGKMQTTYGIYYVYGNHDKGYYNGRDFKDEDMRKALTEHHVTILEDEAVQLTEGIVLVGRQDRSTPGRADMETLLKNLDRSDYIIVLDHQPHDFKAQAQAGVDLVLCGHTHGGQMFPVGITGELSGANDKTYGLEIRDNTAFIVNSGISDWAIRYKTGGAIAEFGVIDIEQEP